MRKNKFSSAADRRWQRRYERIQQRKDEERLRKQEEEQQQVQFDDDFVFGFPSLSQQETQRILDSFNGLGHVHAVPPDSIDTMMLHYRLQEEQAERDRRAVRAIFDQYFETPSVDEIEDYYDAFVERRPTLYEQLEELLNKLNSRPVEPESEPDLDAGDNSALDSFLGEFLAPGA